VNKQAPQQPLSESFEQTPMPEELKTKRMKQQKEESKMQKRLNEFMAKSASQDLMLDELAQYKRRKDPTVEGFMDEYTKGPEKIKEGRDKWMKKGDSPTKRLMCKLTVTCQR
jgi:hypothetical protein